MAVLQYDSFYFYRRTPFSPNDPWLDRFGGVHPFLFYTEKRRREHLEALFELQERMQQQPPEKIPDTPEAAQRPGENFLRWMKRIRDLRNRS